MNPQQLQSAKLHEEWLKHPVTQDAIKILKSRYDHYKKSLQTNILTVSNKESEDRFRSAMTTTETLGILLFETTKFVEQLNNKE